MYKVSCVKRRGICLLLLLALLLACLLSACSDGLSQAQMDAIDAASGRRYGLDWQFVVYCGTHDRWIVVLSLGNLCLHEFKDIGGYLFEHNSVFTLLAYRDGTLVNVEEAYDQGIFTQEQIGRIHATYMEKMIEQDYAFF